MYCTQCTAISFFSYKWQSVRKIYLGKVTRAFSDQSYIFGAPSVKVQSVVHIKILKLIRDPFFFNISFLISRVCVDYPTFYHNT